MTIAAVTTPPSAPAIILGDPVPWFGAKTLAGASIDLGVTAGRWIVLCFPGPLSDPASLRELNEILEEKNLFNDDHLIFFAVLTEPPANAESLVQMSHPALGFMMDYDHSISRLYGAEGSPRTIVLDPMLRAIANVARAEAGSGLTGIVRNYIRELPPVDESAGVPLTAPALIVPRIFDFAFCDFLVELYEKIGGKDSGFMLDKDGKTGTVINHKLKRRQDLVLTDPHVREAIRERVVRRLVPAMERFFQFRPTRMDRYLVSCYDSELGGHFFRHRDNVNAGARHRRFAVSINLNKDYDGCDLIFPEFGRRTYRAPHGGGIVFSTGALHQVTPITRGRRYAFVPFLYGEEDVKTRLANNALLQDGEKTYSGENDLLFPSGAKAVAVSSG